MRLTLPPRRCKDLYGVVVEVGMDRGLDLLAVYSDRTARYYNFGGASIVWERADVSLDGLIEQLLNAAQVVVGNIGPWTQPRPAPVPKGHIRINMITPSGLHFGQAPFQLLASDPVGGPVVTAATILMKAMIKHTKDLAAGLEK